MGTAHVVVACMHAAAAAAALHTCASPMYVESIELHTNVQQTAVCLSVENLVGNKRVPTGHGNGSAPGRSTVGARVGKCSGSVRVQAHRFSQAPLAPHIKEAGSEGD